jgi:DNA invertase Pin-like site-specific DNA recombinase
VTGDFKMVEPPGFAQEKPAHKAKNAVKIEQARKLKAEGMAAKDIAAKLDVSEKTIQRWTRTGHPDISVHLGSDTAHNPVE